ncbi:MAG: urea ABC transporter substrate-binding protein [Pseudomonadota bacterium]
MASSSFAADTIKIGVLHSLTGTMAISETTLKDTVLMMVDNLNKKGGLLGKKVEAIVADPHSDWSTYAAMMEKLLVEDKVAVVFGCWTSVSRKFVLPVVEKYNGLLFYPVQFEGQEQSSNIMYTGATPNQQAIPAVEYLMSPDGGSVKRFYLVATDYVYPRTTNAILKSFLKSKNVADKDIKIVYTPFGEKNWSKIVTEIKDFADSGLKTAVISTINGDANIPFYNELAAQGITSDNVPVMAFSVSEEELAGIDVSNLVGHLASWNYFMSIDTPENQKFIQDFQAFTKNDQRVTNDPMEATYIGFNMWVDAVKKAGSTDVTSVTQALSGMKTKGLTGFTIEMDRINHHLHKPVFIGEIQADGQFSIVWKSKGLVEPKNWSPYLPDKWEWIKGQNDQMTE